MARSPEHARSTRVALAAVLLILAVLWPFVEIGPRGPVLLTVAPAEGVVALDLLALIPLALAIFVLLPLLRRSP
jgi:predicted anti-sigma-YlaC factor YlaD